MLKTVQDIVIQNGLWEYTHKREDHVSYTVMAPEDCERSLKGGEKLTTAWIINN